MDDLFHELKSFLQVIETVSDELPHLLHESGVGELPHLVACKLLLIASNVEKFPTCVQLVESMNESVLSCRSCLDAYHDALDGVANYLTERGFATQVTVYSERLTRWHTQRLIDALISTPEPIPTRDDDDSEATVVVDADLAFVDALHFEREALLDPAVVKALRNRFDALGLLDGSNDAAALPATVPSDDCAPGALRLLLSSDAALRNVGERILSAVTPGIVQIDADVVGSINAIARIALSTARARSVAANAPVVTTPERVSTYTRDYGLTSMCRSRHSRRRSRRSGARCIPR
jgi:hypothetical protein